MKKTLWQPMAVGLAALLLAMPVYAENTQAPDEAATPAAQTAPAQKEENKLAPYLGKKITKQTIAGNVAISEEEIAAALKTKQGMEFTEEGLSQDLSAIYDLGWFYDMHPEFKLVPEGVQIIYHVLENPVYKDVKVNGEPLSLTKEYTIATNDFTAAGGDTYYAFKRANLTNSVSTGISLEDALIEYITEDLNGVIGEDYAAPKGRIDMNYDSLVMPLEPAA